MEDVNSGCGSDRGQIHHDVEDRERYCTVDIFRVPRRFADVPADTKKKPFVYEHCVEQM